MPLSLAQERLWVMARMDGDAGAACNEPMPFDIRGPLDRDVLIDALRLLAARHEALRTRLVPFGGSARQVVDPPDTGFPVTFTDLAGLPDRAERFARMRAEVEGTPFRPGEEPMARGCLVGADDEVLTRALRAPASDNDVSLCATVLTGWSALLSLLLGQDDTVVRAPGVKDVLKPTRYLNVHSHHHETARDYAVPESSARVVLTQATAVADEDTDVEGAAARPRAFWRDRVSGEFVVEPVSCGHWDMPESDELPRVAAVLTAEPHRPASAPGQGETERTTPSGTSEAR